MKKGIRLFAVFVSIMILTACNSGKTEQKDVGTDKIIPPRASEASEKEEDNTIPMLQPDFSSEDSIKEYLVGEWVFDKEYISDVTCKMDIDKNLDLQLSFYNSYTNEFVGDYFGKIKFERQYASPKEGPDLISIELTDTEYPGGEYFFLHRTTYNEKNVMSLFFAGNGNCIFDMLGSEEWQYAPGEIIFEKESVGISKLPPRKNDEFYAVYWGKGSDKKSIWLDDVLWTPQEEGDFESDYPWQMTVYENDVQESILYNIATDDINEILGDDLFPSGVYFVETDEDGSVKQFIDADRKNWIDNDYTTSDIRSLVFDIIKNVDEVKEYLNLGMIIEFEGDTIMIEGEEYYELVLGTQHEDYFVAEIYYGVNTFTHEVYWYDVINDRWEPVSMG